MLGNAENRVGLWINASKPDAKLLAQQIGDWFTQRAWQVLSDWEKIKQKGVNFLLTLGGDGTLLEAAREAAPYAIPVLGINLGRLGFLCELERGDVFPAIEKYLRGEYNVEERLMLSAELEKAEGAVAYLALNDVVFMRRAGGVITLQADLSGIPSISYPTDGLIVATPTGSTAYSLSAGGPIISPDVEAIVLTPLSAHSLSARPMVVSHREVIEIFLPWEGESCMVTFDGNHTMCLQTGEKIKIQASPLRALLIRFGENSFPKIVKEKLRDRWHDE